LIDDLNRLVRQLVRTVMGMPANSVRPSDQLAPAGGQVDEIASVKIIDCQDSGWSVPAYEADEDDSDVVNEILDTPKVFTASVQFFRRPATNADASSGKTAVGAAKYSNAAFDRAARLGVLLQRSASTVVMQSIGLCLLTVGQARNLTAIADATWESRGQIDLTFNVVDRISAPVDTVATIPIGVTIQTPDDVLHTITEEVTP